MNAGNKCIALLLSCLMPGVALASETGGAVLDVHGNVQVNSELVHTGKAINVADMISTGTGGQADLTAPGLMVTVVDKSDLKFDPQDLQLKSGVARVATTKGTKTEFKGLTITPKTANAKYAVGEKDGQYMIAAVQGDLVISSGSHSMLLASGNAMTRTAPANGEMADGGGMPQGPQPTAKMPDDNGGFWTPWHIGLIVALGVALGFLIGYAAGGGFNSGSSSSPSNP